MTNEWCFWKLAIIFNTWPCRVYACYFQPPPLPPPSLNPQPSSQLLIINILNNNSNMMSAVNNRACFFKKKMKITIFPKLSNVWKCHWLQGYHSKGLKGYKWSICYKGYLTFFSAIYNPQVYFFSENFVVSSTVTKKLMRKED